MTGIYVPSEEPAGFKDTKRITRLTHTFKFLLELGMTNFINLKVGLTENVLNNFCIVCIEIDQFDTGIFLAVTGVIKVDLCTVVLLKVGLFEEFEFLREIVLELFSVQRI